MSRDLLLRRIEIEARAFAAADHTMDTLRLGRVLGLLEGGTIAGYWRKRDADAAAELIRHRYKLSRIRDVLLKAERVELLRATDVAALLGVSYQRVQQLVAEGRLPKPEGRSGTLTPVGAFDHPGVGRGRVVGWSALAHQTNSSYSSGALKPTPRSCLRRACA